MADLESIVFGGIGGVITSLAVAFFIDPKKERIRLYNSRVDDLIKLVERAHEQSIAYWSGTERAVAIEPIITMLKTSTFDQIYTLNDLCPAEFRLKTIAGELQEYFGIVTGGNFQTAQFAPDLGLINSANNKLSNLRNSLQNSKISLKLGNILSNKVN